MPHVFLGPGATRRARRVRNPAAGTPWRTKRPGRRPNVLSLTPHDCSRHSIGGPMTWRGLVGVGYESPALFLDIILRGASPVVAFSIVLVRLFDRLFTTLLHY